MLEESDENEVDEDFELYLSDDEKFDNLSDDLRKDLLDEHADSIPFTQEELCESLKLQITEKALIHDPPRNDRILIRSQTKSRNIDQEKSFKDLQKNKDEIEEIEDRNDPPDKGSDTEDDEKTDNEEKKSVINDNKNQIPRILALSTLKHLKIVCLKLPTYFYARTTLHILSTLMGNR